MAIYAVGDIHGHYGEWLSFKNKIESKDSDAEFILVGDIIDRGPDVLKMVNWAMKNITDDGKYQMIIGNHEAEKIDWWNEYCSQVKEIRDDPEQLDEEDIWTDRYYYSDAFIDAGKGLDSIKKTIDWFKTLPYYKDIKVNDQRFVIVHANLPYKAIKEDRETLVDNSDLDADAKNYMVWDRGVSPFDKLENTILIHGHTPTIMDEAYPFTIKYNERKFGKILNLGNRYNIDCGLVYKQYRDTANLAALRLDNLEEIYLYET